jgi:hypothetical protein
MMAAGNAVFGPWADFIKIEWLLIGNRCTLMMLERL